MIASLPVERALSTTFFISQGERNWPFLMFTGLPCERRADDEIGLSAQERRRLQHIDDRRDFAERRVLVHVGQHRHAELAPHVLEHLRRPCLDARAAKALARGAVRLVVGGLEDERDAEAGGDFLEPPGDFLGAASALSITQGPAIRKNGRSMPTSVPASFMLRRGDRQLARRRCARAARE